MTEQVDRPTPVTIFSATPCRFRAHGQLGLVGSMPSPSHPPRHTISVSQQHFSSTVFAIDQAKPVRDSPELFAACFRCGASNPLLSPFTAMSSGMASSSNAVHTSASFSRNGAGDGQRGRHGSPLPWGDACTTCRHPFVRSFVNFESLPLVEFQPDSGCVMYS